MAKKKDTNEVDAVNTEEQKNTVTMLNPVVDAEPHEAEVHSDMVKHWEQDGWKVK
ncbi:hypothetical protein [Gilliamella sp. Pas-s25]|uniref:hypothetical protein n=1 Tax=Gilliamella sp. Pas-s25 TaxID=2687310 RepID=UPI00135E4B89|nr:hypothetical protein [Gilliamella sp. Pas-s25]MWP63105.1 hypothetical protein [Gilliamella sp. Pas-s25]